MQQQTNSLHRKRKALLYLPLLVVPFLTLAFWAMGGGNSAGASKDKESGLNLALPNAQLSDDRNETKLSFYEAQARQTNPGMDSTAFLPFEKSRMAALEQAAPYAGTGGGYDPLPPGLRESGDANEAKVYRKLAELNQQLHHKEGTRTFPTASTRRNAPEVIASTDIDRLESRMQMAGNRQEEDRELAQLNGMMEKILDIQHPERVKRRLDEKQPVVQSIHLPVRQHSAGATESCLDSAAPAAGSSAVSFLGLSRQEEQKEQNALEAAVYQSGTIVAGAVITFRLLSDATVGGVLLPRGNFIAGVCQLSEERLEVQISSVRLGRSVYPVRLEVYDMDGIRGIYIPGAITRDVAKGAIDNATQVLEMPSLDPSLGARATGAGISAARTLLTKKTKLVRVTVKGGYRVLLKEK